MRQRPVLGGRCHERAALARTHCLGRRPKAGVGPRLDLDDNELGAAAADQVELTPSGPEAGPHHLVAAPLEEIGGRLLPRAAEV